LKVCAKMEDLVENDTYDIGDTVVLDGLQNAIQYNKKFAVVREPKKGQRYPVEITLDRQLTSGNKILGAKTVNMTPDFWGLWEYVDEISKINMTRNRTKEKKYGYDPKPGDEDNLDAYERDPRIYEQIWEFSKEQEARIRSIGEEVGKIAGMEGLHQVYYAVHYQKMKLCELLWNGVKLKEGGTW
jgi:hypothetical protein